MVVVVCCALVVVCCRSFIVSRFALLACHVLFDRCCLSFVVCCFVRVVVIGCCLCALLVGCRWSLCYVRVCGL